MKATSSVCRAVFSLLQPELLLAITLGLCLALRQALDVSAFSISSHRLNVRPSSSSIIPCIATRQADWKRGKSRSFLGNECTLRGQHVSPLYMSTYAAELTRNSTIENLYLPPLEQREEQETAGRFHNREENEAKNSLASSSSFPITVAKDPDGRDGQVVVSKKNYAYKRGLVTLGFITLLFASNSPAIRAGFAASTMSQAPPVLLMNAAVSVMAAVGLVLGGPIFNRKSRKASKQDSINGEALNGEKEQAMGDSISSSKKQSMLPIRAGVELGIWKFLGTTANLYGLSLTTSSRGAFLVQLTTLIVPVVQGIMGIPIPQRIVKSIALALVGMFVFTREPTSLAADAVGRTAAGTMRALGDALCVVTAGFYATYDLRVFRWGKVVPSGKLISVKIFTQALLSVALLLCVGWGDATSFLSKFVAASKSDIFLISLVALWSGMAVNAIAPMMQVGAVQGVGPTRAQTVYASQPLWAALMSYAFLGEKMGWHGLVGGGAFISALILAATAEPPEEEK